MNSDNHPGATLIGSPLNLMHTESHCRDEANVRRDWYLICQATSDGLDHGHWSFTMHSRGGSSVLTAEDHDTGDLNRLSLLAAVRGLEEIEGGGNVTLLSSNRYLIRSIVSSLPRWRENAFAWELNGESVPIQHSMLWRRIDRATRIHRVSACLMRNQTVPAIHHAAASPVIRTSSHGATCR